MFCGMLEVNPKSGQLNAYFGMTKMKWHDLATAEAFAQDVTLPDGVRLRNARVVRDYGIFDRREAPQYFAEVHTKA